MSFGHLIVLDARQLLRERLALAVLALGLVCAVAAVMTGSAWIDRLDAERTAFLSEADAASAKLRQTVASPDTDDATRALLPVTVTRPVALPVPVLADFTIGRSDIEPTTATIRMRYRADTLFRLYQMDNPERMMRGRLDLSFVVVVIAPLLLIAIGYGVFAGDRDRGTARLILAQAGSPIALLAARSVNRLLLVLVPLLVGAVALLLLGPALEGRWSAAVLWLGIGGLGLIFWWAVILLLNTTRLSAESAALALVGLWAATVFVAPAAINAAAQALYPPPSRLAQIVDARRAELTSTAAYENDHPALGGEGAAAYRATVAKNYAIGLEIEAAVAPGIRAFETQLAGQQAVAARARWLSPPMIVSSALAGVAQTDTQAYASMRQQALYALADFKRQLAAVVSGEGQYDVGYDASLKGFRPMSGSPRAQAITMPILILILLTAALLTVAVVRARRLALTLA